MAIATRPAETEPGAREPFEPLEIAADLAAVARGYDAGSGVTEVVRGAAAFSRSETTSSSDVWPKSS
jgi:hypothetical protein